MKFTNTFYTFVLKFLVLFLAFYYGTKFLSGLATPGGYYIPFIEKYVDYVSWLRHSLVYGATYIAALFGYQTEILPGFLLKVVNAKGVFVSYSCAGYGVMSFWAAFTIATEIQFLKKTTWLICGLLILWMINVLRIGLFLVSINKGWKMPLGIDHHTWFNIVAYLFIFIMIYFFNENTEEKNND